MEMVRYKTEYSRGGGAPIQCSNDWTYADDAYHYFDENKSGIIQWRKLILEAVKDKPTN